MHLIRYTISVVHACTSLLNPCTPISPENTIAKELDAVGLIDGLAAIDKWGAEGRFNCGDKASREKHFPLELVDRGVSFRWQRHKMVPCRSTINLCSHAS